MIDLNSQAIDILNIAKTVLSKQHYTLLYDAITNHFDTKPIEEFEVNGWTVNDVIQEMRIHKGEYSKYFIFEDLNEVAELIAAGPSKILNFGHDAIHTFIEGSTKYNSKLKVIDIHIPKEIKDIRIDNTYSDKEKQEIKKLIAWLRLDSNIDINEDLKELKELAIDELYFQGLIDHYG